MKATVVVGYDRTPHSEWALMEGGCEAVWRGTAGKVVHAIQWFPAHAPHSLRTPGDRGNRRGCSPADRGARCRRPASAPLGPDRGSGGHRRPGRSGARQGSTRHRPADPRLTRTRRGRRDHTGLSGPADLGAHHLPGHDSARRGTRTTGRGPGRGGRRGRRRRGAELRLHRGGCPLRAVVCSLCIRPELGSYVSRRHRSDQRSLRGRDRRRRERAGSGPPHLAGAVSRGTRGGRCPRRRPRPWS